MNRALCFKKRYEFQVTNFQMAMMLLYNGQDETLSYEYIMNTSGLKDSELKRTLEVITLRFLFTFLTSNFSL